MGADRCPAESTVSEILRRHGLSRVGKRRGRAVPTEQPFKDCREANAVWCADFKGWFRTTNGRKCTPLTISDAHSRYLLCCQGLGERRPSRREPISELSKRRLKPFAENTTRSVPMKRWARGRRRSFSSRPLGSILPGCLSKEVIPMSGRSEWCVRAVK